MDRYGRIGKSVDEEGAHIIGDGVGKGAGFGVGRLGQEGDLGGCHSENSKRVVAARVTNYPRDPRNAG